jgi:phosphoglycerate dehydrogenase-like enzyme
MKKSAFLINVARGKIVDQTALTEALQNGAIAGAGLDVTFPEPLPPDHPLWAMDNVILTPHWAGTSPKSWDRVFPLFCENLRRYLAGEPLLNVVDKARGY